MLSGRKKIVQQSRVAIKRSLDSKNAKGQIILGLHGTGKTVLLHRISQIAGVEGCETILFESDFNRPVSLMIVHQLHRLLLRLDQQNSGSKDIRNAYRSLNSFTGNKSNGNPITDLTDLLLAIGKSASKRKTTIVILVDEIHTLTKDDLGTLILALDKVTQKNMPFLLFGAGLPQLASFSGDIRSGAERLFEVTEVDKLGRSNARKALKSPASKVGVAFEPEALELVLEESRGYPGLLQAWGSAIWEVTETSPVTIQDVKSATSRVRDLYDNGLFKEKVDGLTRRQLEYAMAMASLDHLPARSTEVAHVLGMDVSKAAPVRDEIIGKGIAFSPTRGLITFSMPTFKEFLLRSRL